VINDPSSSFINDLSTPATRPTILPALTTFGKPRRVAVGTSVDARARAILFRRRDRVCKKQDPWPRKRELSVQNMYAPKRSSLIPACSLKSLGVFRDERSDRSIPRTDGLFCDER
jgi:hypothetical protein